MKIFGWPFFLLFIFYPPLSLSEETPPPTGPEQCQSQVKSLQDQKTEAEEEYNEDCDSENSSSAKCMNLSERIKGLIGKISSQSQKCQNQALDIKKREIEDANAKVKKHNRNTKMLGLASGAIGAVVLKQGLAPCPTQRGCDWPKIALGTAGIAMGIKLFNKTKELDKVVDEITDTATTCVGANCTPPPPPPATTPPTGGGVGTGMLGGLNTLPDIPPFSDCEPFCPCPGEPEKLPPNCKIVNDKDGTKVTFGEDKDKDGFGDEQITAADAGKYRNNPGAQAAVAAAKAPYADMLAELEEDLGEDEELLAEADESAAGEGFLSGGATVPGRSAASSSGSGRRRPRDKGDDVNKTVQGLMAQFLKKKKKKAPKTESKLLGNSKIGVAQDNIFHMVHRRYQERRGEREFFEQRGGGSSLTHNISK